MVVSQNTETLLWAPIFHSPYYGAPKKKNTILGNPHMNLVGKAPFQFGPGLAALEKKASTRSHMSYSLNSFKGGILGIIWRTTVRVIKWDTRNLDYGSYDSQNEL